MQIKRYEVSKIQDAMQQIKTDLGPEAIILSTKTIKHSNPQKIEVIAAIDITELNNQIPGRAWSKEQDGERRNGSFELPQGDIVHQYDEIQRMLEKMGPVNDIREEIKSLKDNVELLVDVIGLARFRQESEHLAKMYQTLTANGISKGKTCHIIDEMRNGRLPDDNEKDYASCLKLAERTIASSLSKIDGISKTRRIKAFIGPTGVGKTTTLAKLAASFCVDKRKKVGLVTMDTFRIAAVEQLKVYAKIIDVPLQVATSKISFEKSLKALSDADVILVDTAGRSPNDAEFIKNIHETFFKNTGVEINLLLSPSMSRDHLLETENYYRLTEYDNLILTKVDECNRYGVIYDLVRHAGKPVGYLTNGQNVPQDIENATPEKLAKLIVQNSIH